MTIIEMRNELQHCRYVAGLSQAELDRKAKVSKNTTYRIESGKTKRPHPKTCRKLAKALKKDIYKVFPPRKIRPSRKKIYSSLS